MNMSARTPAEVFPPGEFIRDEIEARDWSQLDLAEILGRSPRLVNEIIVGKRQITPQTASGLADAFGTDPQFWLNLESAYQLSKVRDRDPYVARRSALYQMLPIKELVKRHWIEQTESVDVLEQQVMSLLEIGSLDQSPSFAHAAKGTTCERMPPAQLAWLCRVRQIARRVIAPRFSERALRAAIKNMRDLLRAPDDVRRVPKILHSCGVRFVIVESLPGSKIDGVCFWLDDDSPVVGMSLRFDRIDNFWFVLRHELEHVLRRDGVEMAVVDADLQVDNADAGSSTPAERSANEAASDFCVPKAKMESWIARKSPYFSEVDLLGFAKTQNVHPGLVAGQLRNTIRKYHLFTKHLVKVRGSLVASAIVDGWGEAYPTL
jgi:HTH-type transcriptional regulator / antitoxin HigA